MITQGARFQAVLLRGHLKLMSLGMKHSSVSRKAMLAKASVLTGESYKNSVVGCVLAMAALTAFAENQK